jgi:rfaE bifunctional protein kinase chain/domain
MLTEAKLKQILEALPRISVAVVGDLFLDKYLDLDARLTEVSVETGLEAYQIVRVRCYPGAGGTVLNNLRALGVGELHAVSVIGSDGEGFELLRALRERKVDTSGVIVSDARMTPTYTKPMLSKAEDAPRELNRLDIKNRTSPSTDQDRHVIAALDAIASKVHAVIVADQVTERNQGVITDAVREHLGLLASRYPKCVYLADSRSHIGLFRNVLVKPNRSELLAAVAADRSQASLAEPTHSQVEAAARELANRTNRAVYATVGADGILYVDGGTAHRIPGVRVSGPIDIVGAGDSTTAGIVSGLCSGAAPVEAAQLGCLVASITIQQLGVTGTATPEQILARFRETYQN